MSEPEYTYRAWWYEPKKRSFDDGLAEAIHYQEAIHPGRPYSVLVCAADLGERVIPNVRAQEPGEKPVIHQGEVYFKMLEAS